MAASCAAARGLDVRVLEQQPAAGAKHCYSAMGAAAVSNVDLDVSRFHGRHARFVSDALKALPQPALVDWFRTSGLELETAEHYGLIQPPEGGGQVIEALGRGLAGWQDNRRVTGVQRTTDGFRVAIESEPAMHSRALVLATGGSNLPQLGGGEDGYRIAQSLGHSCEPSFPALVGLTVQEDWVREIPGLWMDVGLKVLHGKRTLAESSGSMLFTAGALTGEAVFNVSGVVGREQTSGSELELAVNFFPGMSAADVAEWLRRVFGERTREPANRAIDYILPGRLGGLLLRRQNLKAGARVMQMSESQRDGLLREMLDTRLKITGTLGMRAAEGASGGVSVRDVDPRSFESKLTPNLYIVGRLLDVHADWGGFEQHFALASGWVAGQAVLKKTD